ncbi:MAG: hypothetical protein AAGI71_02600 [Bacteroidota bacterium]
MSDSVKITRRHHGTMTNYAPGRTHVVTVKLRYKGYLVEMEDLNFHFDSAVMMPDHGAAPTDGSSPGQARVTGLAVLALCYQHLEAHPDQHVLVVGHTDRSGDVGYNQTLSELRAANVLAAMQGDRGRWADIAMQKSKVEDYQQILLWLTHQVGWACDPGGKSNVHDPATRQAVADFQSQYIKRFGRTITVDGVVGLQTWGAFFDVYMQHLGALIGRDADGLQAAQSFQAMSPCASIGCGEGFPITPDRTENYKSPIDRRVEILFFDPGEEPVLNCATPHDTCTELYDKTMYEIVPIPATPVVPPPVTNDPNAIAITSVDTPHFVPELEAVSIKYEIKGPLDQVAKVRFRVVSKHDPSKVLLEKEVPGPYAATGAYDWNGEVTDATLAGFANLGESPYLVQFKLYEQDGDIRDSNTEEVAVLPAEIEIFVEDPGMGKVMVDEQVAIQAVRDELATGSTSARVRYDTPVFKVRSAEMNDDSSYTTYKAAVGDGHRIAFFARIWLKGKDGSKKRGPAATAHSQVLWDVGLDTLPDFKASLGAPRNVHAKGKTFIEKVANHKATTSQPAGYTAHQDVGGMRTTEAGRKVEYWSRLDSGWSVSKPSARVWSRLTEAKPNAMSHIDADAGLFFCGGRMAGDTHHIRAYIETKDHSADTLSEATLKALPAEQTSNTITLLNWRTIDVVNNYLIGAATQSLDLAALEKEYDKAAMTIHPKAGVTETEIQGQWKTNYQKVITPMKASDDFIKHAILDDPQLYPVRYRNYADYEAHLTADQNVFGRVWRRIKKFFGADTEDDYRAECKKYAPRIIEDTVRYFPLANHGLTFYKFGAKGDHNQWKGSYVAGRAPSVTGYSGRNKSVFFVFTDETGTDTLIHEVGHLVFLSHAPGHFSPGKNPPGYQPNAHNKDETCLMSYDSSASDLCGLCILKLGGYAYTKIGNDGTVLP